jgi:hypothetical protein
MPAMIATSHIVLQTSMMMYAAGCYWAAGGRNIKAQSNEEFNNLMHDNGIGLIQHVQSVQLEMMKDFKSRVPQSDDIQNQILDEMVKLEHKKVDANVRMIKELPPEYVQQIFGQGVVNNLGDNIGGLFKGFENLFDKLNNVPTTPNTPSDGAEGFGTPVVNPTHHPEPAGPSTPTVKRETVSFKHLDLSRPEVTTQQTFTNNNEYEDHVKYLDNMVTIYQSLMRTLNDSKTGGTQKDHNAKNFASKMIPRYVQFIRRYQDQLQQLFGKKPDYSNRGL